MVEVVHPELEFFSKPSYQSQIEKCTVREFSPISSVRHQSPLEFVISSVDGQMPDMSRSSLYVKAKIQTAADANPIAATQVGPINMPIHSMWSAIEVYLGDTRISDANALYPYRAILETLLSFPKDALESQKQSACFYKDTPGQMDVGLTNGNGADNTGLVSRFALFTTGTEVEMYDRLHLDICYPQILIPSGVKIRIRLIPTTDNFVLISSANVAHKFVLTDAKLFIPFKHLSDAQNAAFEMAIARTPVRLPIRRVALKQFTIPANVTTNSQENIIMGRLPKRIILAMVTETAMTGTLQASNPFNFQHFNLNYLALSINGDLVPTRPFQPNFTTNQYIREYMSLFDVMDFTNKGQSLVIGRSDYSRGYTLFGFDLSADNSAGANTYDARRTGSARIEIRFSQALAAAINVIIFAEYLGEITIDKYRNILTDF